MHTADISEYLTSQGIDTIFVCEGVNSDSGISVSPYKGAALEGREVKREGLFDILCESRVIKTEQEIEALRWASKITVEGHIRMMKEIVPGMRERTLGSIF